MLRRFEVYALDGPAPAVEAFATAARDCARFIPEVRHSAIGRFDGPGGLNFAWEHGYDSPASYRRYMAHPFHAAVLDRYLMRDSPECVLQPNDLGVGLIGYGCPTPEYVMPGGARRVIAMRLAAGAADDFARVAAGERGHGGMTLSVFRPNDFGPRWFDGETVTDPDPVHTHIWEQGFATLAAARGHDARWRERVAGMMLREVELVYAIEPGFGYAG